MGQLKPGAYLIVLALFAGSVIWHWQHCDSETRAAYLRGGIRIRRFKRLLPGCFILLAALGFMGGILHPPNNIDALAYRLPRVWHWLAEGRWHWIHCEEIRMNALACGYEWLSAPIMALTRTDRGIFVINVISLLLIPGLIFSLFSRLGVRRRVAWYWMWIIPAGYVYAMQSGSISNDIFYVVYALAAVDFALRAREEKSVTHAWFSIIAFSLATGAKLTNLPLGLPWLIALWPSLPLFWRFAFRSFGVLAFAALISLLPTIVLNLRFAGSWRGVPPGLGETDSLLWGIVGNSFQLLLQNTVPPIFPYSPQWNEAMKEFVRTPLGSRFTSFDGFGHLARSMNEQTAGLGTTVCLFTVVSIIAARMLRRFGVPDGRQDRGYWQLFLLVSPYLSLLVFMAKTDSWQNGRYLASYYPLFFPLLLAGGGHSMLVRQRWWRLTGALVILFSACLVAGSRQRPLFPVQTVLGILKARFPHKTGVDRVRDAYEFPAENRNQLLKVLEHLPPETRVIGFAAYMSPGEAVLWVPFSSRQIKRVQCADNAEEIRAAGIHYMIVEESFLKHCGIHDPREYLGSTRSTLITTIPFLPDPQGPMENRYLIRLEN